MRSKIVFFASEKSAILSLLLVAPPPPQSMLEMCIRSRGLACRCYFPTLIGGAGGRQKLQYLRRVETPLLERYWRRCVRPTFQGSSRRRSNFAAAKNFSKISVRKRAQSHVPHHADARHSCWGHLRVVSKLRTTERRGFWRDLGTVNVCQDKR